MTGSKRRYFSGTTLEQAIMQAARHHQLEPEDVAYRKIEKRHGFLRRRRGIVIEVDPEAPRRTTAEIEEGVEVSSTFEDEHRAEQQDADVIERQSCSREAEPLAESSQGAVSDAAGRDTLEAVPFSPEVEEAVRRALEDILSFARLDLTAEIAPGEDQLEIELKGPDEERLVENRGDLLLATQHLLPRLIRGHRGRSIPCRVDSGGFHETRRAELERLAGDTAREVRRRQRPQTLPPMNPAERRIIHLALAEDVDVITESEGRGFFKRVTIRPSRRRPRGFDRYSR
jgi:spoIIIJ-associated protein